MSCASNNDPKSEWIKEMQSIVLVDTFQNEMIRDSIEYTYYHSNLYPILDIGIFRDSIILDYCNRPNGWDTHVASSFDSEYIRYRLIDSNDVWLYVDTSRFIGRTKRFSPIPPLPPHLRSNEPVQCRDDVLAYPVFLKNNQADTIIVANAFKLPLMLEAKDRFGNWLPIEHRVRYHHGQVGSFLANGETILTACPIIIGNYETDLRLAVRFRKDQFPFAYSNSFKGSVDRAVVADISRRYRAWLKEQVK